MADLSLFDLTLAERAALERAVDGPITSTMIADVIAARPRPAESSSHICAGLPASGVDRAGIFDISTQPLPHSGLQQSVEDQMSVIAATISWAKADLAFYRRQMVALEDEMTRLMVDRDGIYSDGERDRRTRHVAVMQRQRDDLLQNCRSYESIITDARNKLAAYPFDTVTVPHHTTVTLPQLLPHNDHHCDQQCGDADKGYNKRLSERP
jgi:hypothetical protein